MVGSMGWQPGKCGHNPIYIYKEASGGRLCLSPGTSLSLMAHEGPGWQLLLSSPFFRNAGR